MSLLQDTKEIQSRFALYCRTGIPTELHGARPERLEHYRRLIFNIVLENLESAFPIAHQHLPTAVWEEMVHFFFSHHGCQSHRVWEIAKEFSEFAIDQHFDQRYHMPCLTDLLRFEWEEMAGYNMEDLVPEAHRKDGDFLQDLLVLHPEHKLLSFTYPVFRCSPEEASEKKGQYFLLLHRDPINGQVHFTELSTWFALVLEQINIQKLCVKELIDAAPGLFGEIDTVAFTETTLSFLEDLKKRKILLGYKK